MFLAVIACGSAWAQVPRALGYHGRLTNQSSGSPVSGLVDFTFTFYDDPSTGTAKWTESHKITVAKDGYFEAKLGSSKAIPDNLFGGGSLYLALTVNNQVLTPRQEIVATPYSIQAAVGGTRTIEGSVDLDINTGRSSSSSTTSKGETIHIRIDRTPKRVSLELAGDLLTPMLYTELPQHSHTLGGSVSSKTATTLSGGGHNHKVGGSTGKSTASTTSIPNHSHTITGATSKWAASHNHALRSHEGSTKGGTTTGSYNNGDYFHIDVRQSQNFCPQSPWYDKCPYGHVITNSSHGFRNLIYYVSNTNLSHSHSVSGTAKSTGGHKHTCNAHSHSLPSATASAAAHTHSLSHGHGHTLKVASAGLSQGYSLSSSAKAWPNQLKVFIDGQDCTVDVMAQANTNWGSTGKSLGDGTSVHPFVVHTNPSKGTGKIDVLKFKSCFAALNKAGLHTLTLAHPKSGGGRVHYTVTIEY